MKKLSLIFASALAAIMMQACHHTVMKDTIKEADSANAYNDTPKKDTSTAVESEVFDDDDAKFAVRAASSGLTEVVLGNLAAKNAKNPRVQEFGAMMATDHTQINKKLTALANSKKISLPPVAGNADQKIIDDLSKRSGNDFDRTYVNDMVIGHKKDIKLFENAAKNARDTDIKSFATKTLVILHKHYDAIADIQKGMKDQ